MTAHNGAVSRLLTVFSHPLRDSYPAAVMDTFHDAFTQSGGAVDVLDLHAEQFDPRFTAEDHAHFWGGPIPPDIEETHRRVEASDRLAFVFPVYWWSMPALMKGWIERVFTAGWAYQYGAGVADRGRAPLHGLLPSIPTVLIGVGGSKKSTYEKYGYDEAMRTQLDVGIFAYCGIDDVESHLIYDVEGDHNAAMREAGLVRAGEIGRSFAAADRQARHAKQEHLARRRAQSTAVSRS